jgi:hypothetical protein
LVEFGLLLELIGRRGDLLYALILLPGRGEPNLEIAVRHAELRRELLDGYAA